MRTVPAKGPASGGILRALLGCMLGSMVGCLSGGGTDIGNALVRGQVMDEGRAVAGAEVILMPAGYNPVMGDTSGRTRSTLTDSEGRFRFADAAPGPIAIEVLHPALARMDWIRPAPLAAGDTLDVASELAPARAIEVMLPADAPSDAYAFLPGSDVHARRSPGGETLRLPHAPAESLQVIGIGSMSAPAAVSYYPVAAGPADTVLDLRATPPNPP
jgi:hypothetical protein